MQNTNQTHDVPQVNAKDKKNIHLGEFIEEPKDMLTAMRKESRENNVHEFKYKSAT